MDEPIAPGAVPGPAEAGASGAGTSLEGGAGAAGVDGLPRVSSRAADTILGLSDDLLPALIARLDASALGELEVRTDAWRVRLRKAYDRRRPVVMGDVRRRRTSDRPGEAETRGREAQDPGHAAHPGAGAQHGAGGAHGGAAARAGEGARPGPDPDDPVAVEPAMATSPAVGYFSPRDGWGPGRHVRSGDVVGYVDCLGVRQEVLSPVDGFLGRLVAQPGEAVEYGQPLVHVDLPAPAPARVAVPEPSAPVGEAR